VLMVTGDDSGHVSPGWNERQEACYATAVAGSLVVVTMKHIRLGTTRGAFELSCRVPMRTSQISSSEASNQRVLLRKCIAESGWPWVGSMQ
jgi:hypothetical protein